MKNILRLISRRTREIRSGQVFRIPMLLIAFTIAFTGSSLAQEVVRKEAPPEIRTLFQALVTAANGEAAAWESFAQAHYTEALLKKQTPAERAEVHQKIADRFGSIAINGIRREMDGPLQVMVKGAKAEGTILVDLDFSSPKIFSIAVE